MFGAAGLFHAVKFLTYAKAAVGGFKSVWFWASALGYRTCASRPGRSPMPSADFRPGSGTRGRSDRGSDLRVVVGVTAWCRLAAHIHRVNHTRIQRKCQPPFPQKTLRIPASDQLQMRLRPNSLPFWQRHCSNHRYKISSCCWFFCQIRMRIHYN